MSSMKLDGVLMAKPAAVVEQLLPALFVSPSASLLLTYVTLETDCATLARYQQWATSNGVGAANASVDVVPGGNVAVRFWRTFGITLTNCIITCRRPPYTVVSVPVAANAPSGNSSETYSTATPNAITATTATTTVFLVSISDDVDLYNALALAPTYGNGSGSGSVAVTLVLTRSLAMASPLWSAQGVTLLRNLSIVGDYANGSTISDLTNLISAVNRFSRGDLGSGGGSSSRGAGSSSSSSLGKGRPVLDLRDLVGAVSLGASVSLSLVDVDLINAGMVFGSVPVPYTGLGFVAPFLWFFNFKRTLSSSTKPPIQLVVDNCDIILYPYDVVHMQLWATVMTTSVEPLKSLIAPYRVGVYDIMVGVERELALEFIVLDAYGMLFRKTRLVPCSISTVDVPLTARGAGAPLYEMDIPLWETAVPVWTHSDLQNALALAQGPCCSPCATTISTPPTTTPTTTTTHIHLFSNISLDGAKWPRAGYNLSCNVTISGSIKRQGGTWINFKLLPRFVTLGEGVSLTLRQLTLINMPSKTGVYVLGQPAHMTLPIWPVDRPSDTSLPLPLLLLENCNVVLPNEEYRMLAYVAGGMYGWRALGNASDIKVSSIGTHSMSVTSLTAFSLALKNSILTDDSADLAFVTLLGPNMYSVAGRPPSSLIPSPAPPLSRTPRKAPPRTPPRRPSQAPSSPGRVLSSPMPPRRRPPPSPTPPISRRPSPSPKRPSPSPPAPRHAPPKSHIKRPSPPPSTKAAPRTPPPNRPPARAPDPPAPARSSPSLPQERRPPTPPAVKEG